MRIIFVITLIILMADLFRPEAKIDDLIGQWGYHNELEFKPNGIVEFHGSFMAFMQITDLYKEELSEYLKEQAEDAEKTFSENQTKKYVFRGSYEIKKRRMGIMDIQWREVDGRLLPDELRNESSLEVIFDYDYWEFMITVSPLCDPVHFFKSEVKQ